MRAAVGLALTFLVACAACGGPSTAPAGPTASRPVIVSPSAAPSVTPTTDVAATQAPSPILRTMLTDVRSGERFTLGGFAGKTVIVQGMAVW
jgi:hypothetical protein